MFSVVKAEMRKTINELPYQKSVQARFLSYLVYNDKESAARYVKNAEFYGRKSKSILDKDSLIDLAVYPLVDNFIGCGMTKVTGIAYIYGATKYISPSTIKFFSNNTQLITSAALTKGVSIHAEKGLSKINNNDFKNFGKSCIAQVGCDAIDEFVIKPAVIMVIGDENSWTASAVRGVGNYVLAQYVMDQVRKIN
jgi:hypothetical protein